MGGLAADQIREANVDVGDVVKLVDVGGGASGLPGIDGSLLTGVGGANVPGEFSYGNRLNYSNGQGSKSAGEIQYTRIKLAQGTTLSGMRTFVANAAAGAKNVRLGLYNQTDPTDESLVPNAKVRETAVVDVSGVTNTFFNPAFTAGNYVVPASGYYWVAIIQDSNSITYATAPGIHPGFLASRVQSGAGTTLPATASGLSNPAGALVFAAARAA